MTDPTPLPGLEPPTRPPGHLERAVRRSIAALAAQGLVPEEQAARTALAVELAQIIELKRQSGRMSTVGNDARVLVELLDKLLPEAPEDEAADKQLHDAIAAWQAAAGQAPVEP